MKKTLLIAFSLCCMALAIQAEPVWCLNESFESGIPAGWSQEVLSTDSAGWVAEIEPADSLYRPDGAADGSGRVIFRNSSGSDHHYKVRLITPAINLTGVFQPRLLFYHAQQNRSAQFDTLRVYYRTAPAAEWKLLLSYEQAYAKWTQEDTICPEASATYQLAFEISEDLGWGVVLDKVQIRPSSLCTGVTSMGITAKANSAAMTLISDDEAFDVLVSAAPLSDPSSADCSSLVFCCKDTTASSIEVTGLTSQTTYYVYARTSCDDVEEGHTAWKSSQFTTSIGFPFAEDFTGYTAMPANWQSMKGAFDDVFADASKLTAFTSTSGGWKFSAQAGVMNGAHVWCDHYTTSNPPLWLVSPAIDLSDAAVAEITFNAALTNSNSGTGTTASSITDGYLHVVFSADGGATWSKAGERIIAYDELTNSPKRFRVNMNAFAGHVVKFAMVIDQPNSSSDHSFQIDDITVDTYDVNCGGASNLQLSSTTSAVNATWSTSGKDSVIIQLASAASFADASILKSDTITAHTMAYTELTANTAYYVRVMQCCPDADWQVKSIKTMMGLPVTHPFSSTSFGDWKLYNNITAEEAFNGVALGAEATTGWTMGSYGKTFGMTNSYAPYAYIAYTYHRWLVSPAIYVELGADEAARLTFMQALSKSYSTKSAPSFSDEDDQFMVLISEDNGATWSKSNATIWACNDSSDYDLRNVTQNAQKQTIDLTKYAGKAIKIAFYTASSESGSTNYMVVGDIKVEKYDANCGGITKLKFAPTYNQVTASWTALGSDSVFAFISSKATYADTLQQQLVKGASLTFSSLEPNTQYYFAVRQVCSEEWAKSSFKTPCAPETVPYSMDFENETANGTPSCWTITSLNGSYPKVNSGETYAYQSTKCLTWGTTATSSIQYQSWASLPEIDNVNTLQVSFRLRRASISYDNPDTLMVGVMTDPTDPTTFEMIAEYEPDSTTYQLIELSLASYEGTGKYICFANKLGIGEFVESSWYDYTYYTPFSIDNVEVELIPTCERMGAVTASAPTAHGITISYAATDASQYQIIITTEAIRPDTLAQVDSSKVVYNQIVSTLLHKIEDATILTDNTPYYTYVRGVCGESDRGKWSEGASFRTLCDAQTLAEFGTETFTDASHMDCWTLGFLTLGSSTSNAYAQRSTTPAAYGPYLKLSKEYTGSATYSYNDGAYAITPKLDFEGDSINHYQVTFTAATTNNTSATNIKKLNVSVVVDPLNPQPEDVKTIVLDYATDSTTTKEYTISFTDYTGDAEENFGQYVMFALYEPANHDSTNYVLIDNISFSRASTCAQIAEASIGDITTTSATFSWESKGAAHYQVLVDTINTRQPDTIAAPVFTALVDTNMAAVTDLSPFTKYYAYVRAICGEGDTAKWSNATAFTTAIGIPYHDALSDISNWTKFSGTVTDAFAGTAPTATTSGWSTTTGKTCTGITNVKHPSYELWSTTKNYWLVSPVIDMTDQAGKNLALSIDLGFTPYGSTLNLTNQSFWVLVSTDNGATWKKENAFSVSALATADADISLASNKANTYTFYLTKFAGQNIKVAFAGQQTVSDGDNYIHIANLAIDTVAKMPFLGVNGAEFSNITMHTADIKFLTKATNVATYQYKLCAAGGDPAEVAAVSSANQQLTITGLQDNTTYDVYVRGFATDGDSCDWAGPVSFTTMMGAPYTQDFADGSIPADWSILSGSPASAFAGTAPTKSSAGWLISSSSTGLPANHARINIYGSTSNRWLVMPNVSLEEVLPGTPVQFAFDFAYTNYNNGEAPDDNSDQALYVVVSTDNGATWQQANSWEWSHTDSVAAVIYPLDSIKTTGNHIELDFSKFIGSTVKVGFVAVTTSGDNDFHVGSISLKPILSDCDNPDSLAISDATESSAVLTFKGDAAKQTVIALSEKSDMSGAVVDTLESGLSYTFTDLQPATTYYVSLYQICVGGNTDAKSTNFTTACGVLSAFPWKNDFEAYTAGTFAAPCWKNATIYKTGYTSGKLFTVASLSSNKVLQLPDMSAGNLTMLATPAFQIADSGQYAFQISINRDISGSSYPEEGIRVYASLHDTIDSAAVELGFLYHNCSISDGGVVTAEDATGWYTYEFTIPMAGNVHILLQGESQYGALTSVDNFQIRKLPTCRDMGKVTISDIAAHSASVYFTNTGAAGYEVLVSSKSVDMQKGKVPADTLFHTTSLLAADSMVVADGLDANTVYYAYVRGLCGEENGQWSAPQQFRTLCEASALPFDVDFATTSDISCWKMVKMNNSYPYIYSSYSALYFYGGGSSSDMMVALPEFEEAANKLTLTLNYKAASSTYNTYAQFIVGVMSDLSDASTFVALDTLDYATTATNYELNLSAAPATHKYIAIRYAGGNSSYGAGYIYKVHVEKTPTCLPLKSVAASHIERRSFDIEWEAKDTTASLFDLIISPLALKDSALDSAAASAIVVADTNAYHAEGLERDHTYYVYVRSNCGADDGVSTWSELKVKTQGLTGCVDVIAADGDATNASVPVYGYNANMQQRSQSIYPASMLTQLVGKQITALKYFVTSGGSEGSSSSWGDKAFTVRMAEVEAADLASSFSTATKTAVYTDALTASVDGGMTIQLAQPFTYNGGNLLIEFELPVAGGWSSCSFAGMDAANASRYAEGTSYLTASGTIKSFLPKLALSYCFTSEACPAVDSIAISNITDASALVSWQSSTGDYANSYDLFYSDTLVTDFSAIVPQYDSIMGLSQAISGLNEFTDYYVYVRTNCDALGHQDGSSDWTMATFRTKANCNEVTNLKATLLTKTSAQITWSPTIQTNNFQYILSDSIMTEEQLEEATLTASGLTDTMAVLTGLNLGTTYYVYVANACGDSHSPYQMTSLLTADGCPAVINLHTTTVAHNAVALAWQRGQFGEETTWEVGYVGGAAQLVSDSSATIIGLEALHTYNCYVRAVCGEGDTSITASISVKTTDLPSPEVLIGDQSANNTYAPVYGTYCDAAQRSQSIYPASMLADLEGKTITGLKYFVKSGSSANWETESFTISMGMTEQENMSAGWVTDAQTDVYVGTLHASVEEGMVITFATPFVYTGGNLVISFDHPVADGYTGCTFYGSTLTSATRYAYSGTYSGTGSVLNFLPQVQFMCEYDPCAPAKMAASDITTSSAKISWLPGGAETSWEVKNSDTKFAEGQLASLHGDTVTALSYALNGLKSGTNYYFYARSLCSTGAGAWKVLQFATEATCFTPAIKDTLDVTATTAYIEWVDTVNTDFTGQYIVAYGPKKGFKLDVDSTYKTDTVQLTHTTLTGLSPITEYSYAVKAACDAADHSFWSTIASFKTECGAEAIPFFYNFNDDATGTMPECWTKLAEDATKEANVKVYSYATTAAHYYDGNLLYFANPRGMAILPKMAEPINQLRITFQHKAEGASSGNLEVGYITDVNDFTTYHAVTALQQASAYELAKVNLNGVPDSVAADAHIAIRYVGGSTSYYYFVDDLTVEYLPTCAAPGFSANSSINSAVLHLLSTDSAFVEVASDALFTNVIDTARTSQDSIVLTGLTGGTTYYVRGYSICGSEKSEVSNVFAFTTKYGLPFIEEFDLTTTLPANWKQLTGEIGAFTTATYGWTVTSTECAGLGANHLYSSVSYSSYSTPTNKILVTPEIELNAQEGYGVQLSFDLALMDGYSSTAKSPTAAAKANRQFWVLISTDGGQTWSADVAGITYSEIGATAKNYTVDLSAYAGQSVMIAFYHGFGTNTNSSYTYIHMDNVQVTEFNPNCLGVTDVMASNITLSGAQIDFSFLGEGQSQAVIAISKTTNPDDAIYVDTLAAGVTTAQITGLDASTTYYALVEQLCDEGATSAWAMGKFMTLIGVPYQPVFESTTIPSDWKRYSGLMDTVLVKGGQILTTTTSGWVLTEGDNVITSNHFRGDIYGENFKYWVVTPTIDMSNCVGDGVVLNFDAYLTAYSSTYEEKRNDGTDDRFAVLVSTDGGQTWIKVAEWNNQGTGDYVYNAIPEAGQSYHLDLTAYAGQSIQVAFYGESTESNADNYFNFGNISIGKVTATNYSGRICYGDDYVGKDNDFEILYPNYHAGLNTYSKYTAPTETTQAKMEVLYLQVDSIGKTEYQATACLGSYYQDENFSFIVTKADTKKQLILTSVGGCDSTITMYMTVVEPVTKEFFDTICSGDYKEWQGKKIYTRGVYPDTTASVVTGCDSINILYLEVKTAGEAELERVLCYGDTLKLNDGRVITETGVYEEHFKTGLGCDSVVTWYVTALPELSSHKNAAINQGESYSDETFQGLTVARHYELTVKSKLGDCDSLVSLNLMIPDAKGMMYDSIEVEQLPYILNGVELLDEFTAAGTYIRSITLSTVEAQITIVVKSATGLDELYLLEQNAIRKLIINNQLVILRDGKLYNAQGSEL